jgi:hypothetical protein
VHPHFQPRRDPAISHVVWRSSTDTIVMYAALSGGTWHLEPIAYQAGTPSLAFTPAGEPAVSYHDRASATVKYAVFADRTWQHFLVDQTGKDQNGMWRGDFTLTSLAISPSGSPPSAISTATTAASNARSGRSPSAACEAATGGLGCATFWRSGQLDSRGLLRDPVSLARLPLAY